MDARTHAEENRSDEVDVGPARGGEPGETDDTRDSARKRGWETLLGRRRAAPLRRLDVRLIDHEHGECDGDGDAASNAQERQSLFTAAPATHLLEDDGIRGKVEVQRAVDDGNLLSATSPHGSRT